MVFNKIFLKMVKVLEKISYVNYLGVTLYMDNLKFDVQKSTMMVKFDKTENDYVVIWVSKGKEIKNKILTYPQSKKKVLFTDENYAVKKISSVKDIKKLFSPRITDEKLDELLNENDLVHYDENNTFLRGKFKIIKYNKYFKRVS